MRVRKSTIYDVGYHQQLKLKILKIISNKLIVWNNQADRCILYKIYIPHTEDMAGRYTLVFASLAALTFILYLLYGANTITTHSRIPDRVYPMMKKNICLHVHGQLGNILHRVAGLHVLALQTDTVPSICSRDPLNVLFENVSMSTTHCRNNICLEKGKKLRKPSDISITYKPDLAKKIKAMNVSNVNIGLGFRNLRYISGYTDSIKAMFQIRKVYREKAQKYLHSLSETIAKKAKKKLTTNKVGQVLFNQKLPVFVAVHVRRTDILTSPFTKVPGHMYFEKAMSYMRQRYRSDVIFVVVTDDPEWSKANLKGDNVYFTAKKHRLSKYEDFAIGVACNHTVMSVGTFGWWMSFLGGGDVVYFKDWVKGKFKGQYKQNEVFPKEWIPMGE